MVDHGVVEPDGDLRLAWLRRGDPAAFRTREIDFTNRLRRYFFHFVFAEGEDTIELARQTGGSRLLTASDRLVQGTGDSSVPRPLTADLERSLEAIRVDYEVGGHMCSNENDQGTTPNPIRDDRRAAMREAADRVRRSLAPEFRRLSADEIMQFLRGASTPGPRPPS